MRKLLVIGLIVGFGFWVYKVPLEGRLPRLTKIKSGLVMQVSSNAFTNNGTIPERYTCAGQNINPQIEFSGVPAGTQSIALIMDDPDAPRGTYTHWVVFNINPTTKVIPEAAGVVPGAQAKNSAGLKQYTGPCPPSSTHRYFFKAYALDTSFRSDEVLDKAYLQQLMTGHILDSAELMGKYSKEE